MRIALAFSLALFAVTAVAEDEVINPDRPGIADGSQTVGRGTFQIETGAERDDQAHERDLSTPTLLRYGVSKNFELRIEGDGYQHVLSDGSGWAPASIGFKYHFLDKPSLGVIARAFHNGGATTGDVRLAADADLSEKWSINPNVGVDFEEHFTAGLAALTVQYNITKMLNVFVDGGWQSQPRSLLLDTGTAWIVNRRTQLDFSIGWGARGSSTPNVFWSAGISRAF